MQFYLIFLACTCHIVSNSISIPLVLSQVIDDEGLQQNCELVGTLLLTELMKLRDRRRGYWRCERQRSNDWNGASQE